MKKNWTNRWRMIAAAAGLAGLLGCGTESKVPPPPAVVNRVSLSAFQGASACQDLETYLEDTAVLQMRTQL